VPRYDALPPGLPPRGLNREAAAQYVGIGVGMFDRLVRGGRLPQPIRVDEPDHWAKYLDDGQI
jgi:hypothetical protein